MSKALSQAAKLKPEIRLAQALSEFCAGLGEARTREFKALQTTSAPDAHDVIRLTEDINRDGSRSHKSWRPYATSMVVFLDRIQTLSRVGEFLVGSSQNLIASGVWTTVKITLGVAIGSLLFFKRLSELFLKIGKSSGVTKDIVQLFPDSKELQDLACEYLIVLVSFCGKIVTVLGKTAIFQLTSPFIAFFDKEASQFEKDLAHWGNAIDKRAMVLLSRRQIETADTITKISRTLAEWAPSEEKKRRALAIRSNKLQDRLCSVQSERVASWRRQRKKGTTEWVFREPDYQRWKVRRTIEKPTANVLWVHGKLGSGKTVLLANIVAELYSLPSGSYKEKERTGPITAYFFCNHDYPDNNTYENIVGNLVQQIIFFLDPDNLCISKLDDYFRLTPSPSLREEALSILEQNLPKDRQIFIVLDALDECKEKVMVEVLEAIRSLSAACIVHLCCSTRTDAPSSHVLSKVFILLDYEISMSSATMAAEMKRFVETEFERRRHIRGLDQATEEVIKEVLVRASEGMYLWLALQIEVLFPLHGKTLLSASDITQLLETPPKDLSEVFDKALDRIADSRYGKNIFQLVAAAQRPLNLSELRIALHVRPGDADWDPMSLPHDERAIVPLCGGGLLEVDEEDDTIRFIHHSARQHLVRRPKTMPRTLGGVSLYYSLEREADVYLGLVCVTYLNYSIFDTTLATKSKLVVNTSQLANQVSQLAAMELNVASRIVAAIKRGRVLSQQDMNIGEVLQRCLVPKTDTAEWLALSDYAHDHWLGHALRFWPDLCGSTYPLFLRLIDDAPEHITVPWSDSDYERMVWADKNRHLGVYLASISRGVTMKSELHATLLFVLREDSESAHTGTPGPLDFEPSEVLQATARLALECVPKVTEATQRRLEELALHGDLLRLSKALQRRRNRSISSCATIHPNRSPIEDMLGLSPRRQRSGRWDTPTGREYNPGGEDRVRDYFSLLDRVEAEEAVDSSAGNIWKPRTL